MLTHTYIVPQRPDRVVILGAGGFVGRATAAAFAAEGTQLVAVGRQIVDLLSPDADRVLADIIEPNDTLVVISAEAPCKDALMLLRNIQMMTAVCAALKSAQPAHVIYVSSDAVYRDKMDLIRESSCAEPASLHGAMHLVREVMLKDCVKGPLAIVRPTLIYGIDDPHNGYGPNRFRRLVSKGEPIILFGDGEERRDHVHVADVAELIRRIAAHRSSGILNAATGMAISFREVAEMIVDLSAVPVAILPSPRSGPMPHNGYRAFDPNGTRAAFEGFRYKTPREGFSAIRDKVKT